MVNGREKIIILFKKNETKFKNKYRVSQKTWKFSDELDIVFVMN